MEEADKGEILQRNTNSSHPGPGEAASLFTDDLILEILSRLPARSVHRFKCVSVQWRNLIADPANRNKLPQTLAGFLYTTIGNNHFASVSGAGAQALFDPSSPFLQPYRYCKDMTQVDTCNGLILYRGSDDKKKASWDDFLFLVCNPATGRWVELPPRPPAPANTYSRIAGLAFDLAVSSHFHVIHFEAAYSLSMTAVSIYSSRTGAWSRRDSGIAENVCLFFSSKCVFVDGMMYVIGNLEADINKYVLVGVDMEGKVWKTISLPYGSRLGTIGSSQGCLHYAIASVDDNNKILDYDISLWFLKDRDSQELVLKHTASIDKLMSTTGLEYTVVEIHPDCDTIFLVSCGGDTLVAYDMQHQIVGCIIHLEKGSLQEFLPYVPLFSESLADVDGQ